MKQSWEQNSLQGRLLLYHLDCPYPRTHRLTKNWINLVRDLSLQIPHQFFFHGVLHSRNISINSVHYYTFSPVCQVQESNWTSLQSPRRGPPILAWSRTGWSTYDTWRHPRVMQWLQNQGGKRASGYEKPLTYDTPLTDISPTYLAGELLSGSAIVCWLVKQDSVQSSGLAAALSFTWSRLQLMKGISDSSCSREASVTSWRIRALIAYCNTNLVVFWGYQEGGFFLAEWYWPVIFLFLLSLQKRSYLGLSEKLRCVLFAST